MQLPKNKLNESFLKMKDGSYDVILAFFFFWCANIVSLLGKYCLYEIE